MIQHDNFVIFWTLTYQFNTLKQNPAKIFKLRVIVSEHRLKPQGREN